ncbi:Uncharacterized protein HZ326_15735, partial [Fusarium oxysporum f. sp. albedinis]
MITDILSSCRQEPFEPASVDAIVKLLAHQTIYGVSPVVSCMMNYLDWKHRPMPEQSSLQSLQDWIEPQVCFGRIPLSCRLQTAAERWEVLSTRLGAGACWLTPKTYRVGRERMNHFPGARDRYLRLLTFHTTNKSQCQRQSHSKTSQSQRCPHHGSPSPIPLSPLPSLIRRPALSILNVPICCRYITTLFHATTPCNELHPHPSLS